MNKYIQAYLLKLAEIREYKLNFLSKLIKPIINILVLTVLYYEIFKITGVSQIGGLGISLFLSYIILSTFQRSMVSPWLAGDQVIDAIKTGSLTSFITKPVDFLKLQFSNALAEISFSSFYSIGIFIFISFVGSFYGMYFPTKLWIFVFYLISLVLSLFLANMFFFIVGASAFWVGDSWSFIDLGNFMQSFLSGAIVPLSISATLLKISIFLPFKSMIYTPSMIYLGKYTVQKTIIELGQQFVWCVIVYFLARFVLYKGLQRFEAQGG